MKHYMTGPKKFNKMIQKANQYLDAVESGAIKYVHNEDIMLFGDHKERVALHLNPNFPVDDGETMFDATDGYKFFLRTAAEALRRDVSVKNK